MSYIYKKFKNIFLNYLKTHPELYKKIHGTSHSKSYVSALKISFIYVILGLVWLYFSDQIIYTLFKKSMQFFELYKGLTFVLLSASIIFSLVKSLLVHHDNIKMKLEQNLMDLNKANKDLLELEDELITLAYTDSLTGLPNKLSFELHMDQLISSKEAEHNRFAFLHLDIDNFKNINDTFGHTAGDIFLKDFGHILKQSVGETDMVARLHGDEFAIILHHIHDDHEIYATLDKLVNNLRKTWVIKGHEFYITFSVGITVFPDDGGTTADFIRNASSAMFFAKKEKSKDNYAFYSKEILEDNLSRINMINDLRKAITNKEFQLFYQPIMDLNTNHISGVETLIRWYHPIKGMIPPMEFIPLAEECGLISEIDTWVLETAFDQKKKWTQKGYGKIRININISGYSLKREGLAEKIQLLLNKTGVDPYNIVIEVTETSLIENLTTSIGILNDIKKLGVRIALDDFGTGYSSLTYLEKLPIDIVKLDRSFVKDIKDYKHISVIVQSMIKLSHDLYLDITAEGIENAEQLNYLKSLLCDYGQGYFFSRPVDTITIEGML